MLNVNANSTATSPSTTCARSASFAEQAAGAIANANLYETEREHVAELMELDRLRASSSRSLAA